MKHQLTCPKCRRVQYPPHCGNKGCVHCEENIPPRGKKRQTWTEDGNGISCPYCGFTAEGSYWDDRDICALFKSEGVKSFSELREKRGQP